MSTSVKPIPDGYQSVVPYLVVNEAAAVIDFIKRAFGAQELLRMMNPDGTIGHTELRIGDSVVMLGGASGQCQAMPSMLYLYLGDVDAAYQRAVEAGGISMKAPENQFYGDRTAAVRDMSGNQWFLATHVEDVSDEELKRRHLAARAAK